MSLYSDLLKKYWGYDKFRPMQEEIIHSVHEGHDTLGLLPTGGGKSITFQIPALLTDGLCVVITPLIALMKDQVLHLREKNLKAVAIYSGMTLDEIVLALDNCIYGNYKFLYISPERLFTELFLNKLSMMQVSLLVVDEAHCISQWGYDFRPSYLHIAEIRALLPGVPVLALTATATPAVVKDIQDKLLFSQKNVFKTSFIRNELTYWVKRSEDKKYDLIRALSRSNGCAIVYVRNRRKTVEITELLLENEIAATYYHAGLDNKEKDKRQAAWEQGKVRVMVCTNAFGMGIDKSDVRLVIHIDLPDSIEAYFQEAGRAGRDRQAATALILFGNRDKTLLERRISDQFPDREFIRKVYDNLSYYLQVPEGDGENILFDFNLALFCKNFHFPILPTFHALKLLEQAGYIELTDEKDNAARVLFTVNRDDLYHYTGLNKHQDALISLLLRSYSGLFTDYAYINEELLSHQLSLSMQQLYELLLSLSKMHILHYIPRKKTPFIIYRHRRIDSKYISISPVIYEERKKRLTHRIEEMCRFVYSTEHCRSRLLLAYFGEKESSDCGQCDVCRRKMPVALQKESDVRVEILNRLHVEPLFIHQLADALHCDLKQFRDVLNKMLESREVSLNNGKLMLAEK